MLIVTLSSVAREIVPAGVETLAVFSVSALEETMGEKSWKIMKERVRKEKRTKSLVDKMMGSWCSRFFRGRVLLLTDSTFICFIIA